MVKSRKKTRPWAGRGLTAATLLAISGLWAGQLGAAEITVDSAAEFKTAMEGLSDGDTVVISSGVEAIDLAGVSVEVTASGVTLEGAASFDLGAAVRSQAGLILNSAGGLTVLSQNSLDAGLRSLTDTLLDNLPSTNIYNSAAESGTHAGISASQGGFSLKNLTLMGTTANIDDDATSGASKYMGLIASTYTLSTDPDDGQGLGVIENVAFVNNVVNATGAVHNVGNNIFFTQRRYDTDGLYVNGADRIETMDGLIGSVFIGNRMYADMTASVGNRDVGGGGAGWVNLTRLDSTIFADNFLRGHHAFGAGLFVYSLGEVTDSVFYNNILESDHDAYGGGLMSSGGIDSISGSVFVGNEARGLDFGLGRTSAARGGAVHSTSAANTSIMDDPVSRAGISLIENSLFAYNRVYNETGEAAMGGAVSAGRALGEIKNTVFYGNSAENNAGSDGVAYGGAIALDVNADGMITTITDSLFWNNSVTSSSGEGGGGAISLGLTSAAATSYTLNLAATSGGSTEFSGNTYNGEANSIYFGKHDADNLSQTDVTVNVKAALKGTVALLDPIMVELDNGKSFTLTNHGTGGQFIWDGVNDLSADGGSFITFESGSDTIFKEGFHLHSSNSDSITIDLDNGANLTMVLSGRNQNMALFEGVDITNSAGAALEAVYYGFTDQSGSWVLSDHDTTAQAIDLTLTDSYDSLTGAASTLTLTTSGTQTIVNLSYQAPTLAYASASPNAGLGRYALQDAWNTILAPYLSAQQQAEYYTRIINDLSNYTAEVFAGQATVALSGSYRIAHQALSGNSRSWFSSYGPSQPAFGDQDGRIRLWADYIGTRIDQDRRGGYSGYDVHNNGAVFGLSYDFNRVWSLGGYMSVSDGETTYDDIRAKVDTNIFQGGLFATYKAPSNGLGVTFDLAYARMDNDSSRRFIGDLYEASFDQSVISLGLEVNYELNPWENGRLIPFAGLRYQRLKQDSLQESTATGLMPLNVRSTDGDTLTSTLGLTLEHNFQFENGGVFTPSLTAAWRHEFGDRDISTRYDIAGVSLATRADSLEQAADAFDLGASFTLVPMRRGDVDFGLNAGYTASFSSDRLEHNFYGGVEIKF